MRCGVGVGVLDVFMSIRSGSGDNRKLEMYAPKLKDDIQVLLFENDIVLNLFYTVNLFRFEENENCMRTMTFSV